jgi:hypothetical protein
MPLLSNPPPECARRPTILRGAQQPGKRPCFDTWAKRKAGPTDFLKKSGYAAESGACQEPVRREAHGDKRSKNQQDDQDDAGRDGERGIPPAYDVKATDAGNQAANTRGALL